MSANCEYSGHPRGSGNAEDEEQRATEDAITFPGISASDVPLIVNVVWFHPLYFVCPINL
jgi:hypothetical protein